MWDSLTRFCFSCFGIDEDAVEYQHLEVPEEHELSHPELESGFSALYHAAREECERAFRTNRATMDVMWDKQGLTVYGKEVPEGFFLLSEWQIDFSPVEFFTFFGDTTLRTSWDKSVVKVERSEFETEDCYLTYTVFKKIPLVAQRDLILISGEETVEGGVVQFSCSVETPEYPESTGVVRMRVHFGGILVKELPGKTGATVCSVSNCTFGGDLPKVVVKKITALAMPKYVSNLKEALKKHFE